MHLNAEELVDLAEGARPESDAPHLAGCAACRTRLAELRAMMAAVAAVDVPEPSPLFWDHFSQRVHDAVAADRGQPRGWRVVLRRSVWSHGSFEPVAALALVLIAVFVVGRSFWPFAHRADPAVGVSQPASSIAHADLFSDSPFENDAPLALVATLAANLDDGEGAALAQVGSADHAVVHMNDAELRELHRILQEEMAP